MSDQPTTDSDPSEASPPDSGLDLARVDRSAFAERVGERFAIPELSLDLELAEAESFGSNVDQATGKPFSCLFRGPLEPALEQRVYRLENEELGRLDLFLVPVGPDGDSMQYEAVFT